jgi:TPR repeat protein
MYATGEGVPKDADYANELFDQAEYMGQDVNTVRQSVGL